MLRLLWRHLESLRARCQLSVLTSSSHPSRPVAEDSRSSNIPPKPRKMAVTLEITQDRLEIKTTSGKAGLQSPLSLSVRQTLRIGFTGPNANACDPRTFRHFSQYRTELLLSFASLMCLAQDPVDLCVRVGEAPKTPVLGEARQLEQCILRLARTDPEICRNWRNSEAGSPFFSGT
jgi:hypothetical protein